MRRLAVIAMIALLGGLLGMGVFWRLLFSEELPFSQFQLFLPSGIADDESAGLGTETIGVSSTATPVATRIFDSGALQTRPADGMVMVYIPAGPFEMGSDEGNSNERPVHTVTLDGFWIDRMEVTNAMYRNCVQQGVCNPPSDGSYIEDVEYDNFPVVFVNWIDADSYCAWAGARLPREAEWEKAARGTDGRTYPWGEAHPNCSLSNFSGCVGYRESGLYPAGASPYGVLGMAGSVLEWTADWYGEDFYSLSPSENPLGPDSGTFRVLRGGSWYLTYQYLRTSFRSAYPPDYTSFSLGFRCASDTP